MNDTKLQKVSRVLVTGAGGPAAIAFYKATKDMDGIEIYMADMDPNSAGLYFVPADRRCILPPGSADDFSSSVLDYCKAMGIDVVVPTVDCELPSLAANAVLFALANIRLITSLASTLQTCVDKFRLMEQLKEVVNLADYQLYDDNFCAERMSYPFVIKPRAGSGSRGVRLINSKGELKGIPADGSHIAQAYLPGIEYSVDVYVARDGRVVSSVVRERMKIDSGVAVIGKTVINEEISKLARDIAQAVGIQYVANIQFRLDAGGTPRLLEINPRFPGTMSLTVAAGVNMPEMCLRESLGESLPYAVDYQPLAMVRSWHESFFPPSELMSPAA